jgi:hypothetical protein
LSSRSDTGRGFPVALPALMLGVLSAPVHLRAAEQKIKTSCRLQSLLRYL